MSRDTGRFGVAIVGVYNTRQARSLPGETTKSLIYEALTGALADAGLVLDDVDGVSASGVDPASLVYDLRLGPAWCGAQLGISMVLEAAAAIRSGQADVVVAVSAQAGAYQDPAATAPWTRPASEFIAPYGLFTAAEFALIARRHMLTYGSTPEQFAIAAATIRNNGHENPDAVYHGRGPFTPEDILSSRMIADPFHLLDCATTSEGGAGLVLARLDRALDSRKKPVYILGGGAEYFGPAYQNPPVWDLSGRNADYNVGLLGKRTAERIFDNTGLRPEDVDVLELYDPFSFEIVRQLEALGFCGEGEGGAALADGRFSRGGEQPITTDGGTMSFSHPGSDTQYLQRVIRGVQQLRGECGTLQVPNAQLAMCSNAGAGALYYLATLLGTDPL